MLGGWLALLASATFAVSNVSVRRGVITGSVPQGLSVKAPVGVPLFLTLALAAGALGEAFRFAAVPALYLSLAGILHFNLGRYCNYRAINAIGANLAVPVQQSSLLVSLAVAIWLLGERLTPLTILAGILVSLPGALALTLSTDFVLSLVPAPDAVIDAARWAWPRS